MTIKLDSTRISTVVKCSECPWWSAFADNKTEGWKVGARHEATTHPGTNQARNALQMHERRAD
jgi:hypothetical protein